jgi:hypothetical protein
MAEPVDYQALNLGPPDFILPQTANAPAGQNGRVAFAADTDGITEAARRTAEIYAGIPGFQTQTDVEADFKADMLRGNWESTPVSDAFFSGENVERLQQLIRKAVYDRSAPKNYVIDKQSVDELKIIMRAIYYQYARNLPRDVAGQVADLNQKVVDWSAPHILSAVDHYYYYLKDISTMPVPLAQPQHLSRAGTKSLPANPFM